MSDQTTTPPTFTEAPASWNTRYVTPGGFGCQLTLRGETGAEVLTKAKAAVDWLIEHDCYPYGMRLSNNNHSDDTKMCPIHNVEMKRREKDGQVWYSHRAPDGSWCNSNDQEQEGEQS